MNIKPEGAIDHVRFKQLVLDSQEEPILICRGSPSNGQVLTTILYKARIHVENNGRFSHEYEGVVPDGAMHDSRSFSTRDHHVHSSGETDNHSDWFIFEDFALARKYTHG